MHFHAALLIVGITYGSCATYYISPSGNNGNSGLSPSQPWQTVSKVNSIALQPGDAALFLGGATHDNANLNIYHSGSAGNPIYFSSYGSPDPAIFNANSGSGISITNTGYLSISNLVLIGSGIATSQVAGLNLYADGTVPQSSLQSVFISNLSVSGFKQGFSLGASTCTGYAGVTLLNVTASFNRYAGIQSYGPMTACFPHTNLLIQNCTVYNNTGDPTYTENHSGDGIVIGGVDGGIIDGSVAYWNGESNGHASGGPVGIWAWNCNNITISHCVSYSNLNGFPPGSPNGADGGGFDLDGGCTNSALEYNLAFNNAGPGYLLCQFSNNVLPTANNTVRYSVSFEDNLASTDAAGGLSFYTPTSLDNMNIYGNTFYTSKQIPSIAVIASKSGGLSQISITGNAIISSGGVPMVNFPIGQGVRGGKKGNVVTFEGNAYWASNATFVYEFNGCTYASLSAWRNATGEEKTPNGQPTGMDTDPGIVWNTGFFQSCVSWQAGFPALPNSVILDGIRNFNGTCL
jgi:hypothetical protein